MVLLVPGGIQRVRGAAGRVVVLLDEPALTLHARAQQDFLRFINERLSPKHQVIYTTHSPFMVETGHLERARIVEDKGPDRGAEVTTEVLATDRDSLFPLQAALGYDIAQNLFVGPNNLLVEGTSDFTYLTLISDH
jgi:predicted ATP-dependent endonuclease of OLD family